MGRLRSVYLCWKKIIPESKTNVFNSGSLLHLSMAYVNLMTLLTREPCFTITPDWGKEFSKHAEVTTALNNVPFYFPKPHQPWKRGRNENTNGLLREYFPKGCDLNKVSHAEIQQIVDKLNKRPRKTLGYRTPFELYYSEVLHLTWQFAGYA